MRKLGVRVVSAALAACMVASVLPVSAFAADGAGTGTGTSTTLPADAQELPQNGNINAGGTYKMGGIYNHGFAIGIDSSAENRSVTIELTDDVNFTPSNTNEICLLRVTNVDSVTIIANGHTVNAGDKGFMVVQYGYLKNLTIEGGTYKSNGTVLQVGTDDNNRPNTTTSLNGVVMESTNGSAVLNRSTGTLTIDGGSFSNNSESNATLWTNAGTLTVKKASVKNEGGTAVYNRAGTVNLNGGNYTSKGITVYNASDSNATIDVTDGTFTRTEVQVKGNTHSCEVFSNSSNATLTIEGGTINPSSGNTGAVINSGTLEFKNGTINATTGAGVQTVTDGAKTTVSGGTITGCNGGISLQAGTLDVTLDSASVLSGNANDIVLRENQTIKIGSNYNTNSAPVSVRVFNPGEGRAITPTGTKSGMKFISNNGSEWTVEYDSADGHYYLHKNNYYDLTIKNATAQKDEGTDEAGNTTLTPITQETESVAEGARVHLEAKASTDPKQEFDKWEVTDANGQITGDVLNTILKVDSSDSTKATLTMPGYAVTVEATYKNKEHKLNYGENITATVNGTNVASGEDVAVDTQVKLEAKNSDDTKEFDKWVVKDASGNEITDLTGILDVDSSDATKATLTMPNQAVTVEATYKTKQHKLTYDKATAKTEDDTDVANGAPVKVGTKVELKAEPAPTNKVFDKWEVTNVSTDKVIDDLTGILDVNGTNATLTMPNYPVHIEAKYKASENALTFDKATATVGGSTVTSGEQVAAGTKVSMKADLPEDEEFTGWTIKVKGEDKTADLLGSTAGDPDISFTMPNGSVEVTANHTTKKNPLNYEDAAATVGGSTVNSGDPVAVGTKVNLKANDPTDDTKEFDHWEVTDANGNEITGDALNKILSDANSADTTLTMPNYEVTIKPVTRTKTNPGTDPGDPSDPTKPGKPGEGDDDPDTPDTPAADGAAVDPGCTIGGAVAAVIVGGTAAWGVYEAGTGIYRMMYMPGIILPTTRAELAMLIWEKADKPEPESDVLFEDIDEDNTDLQKAARWMVEQDLMDEKDDNKFLPGAHVTKLRVCTTWNDAREKGLID